MKHKSWHPLTLLYTDNKLYDKILANHPNYAIKEIVHCSQTGFIKGRQLAENLIKIMEIINNCEKEGIDALLVSFDFFKAFNTVEFEAMFATLVAFNFGPNYIKMVITLFTNPLICASNNGFWTDFWEPTRGCHQGCTFSPLIFALTIETLAIGLHQNADIIGLNIGNTIIKSGQSTADLWTISPIITVCNSITT